MRVIHVLRKPIATTTVAQSLVRHGTGALHIDSCRIKIDPDERGGFRTGQYRHTDNSGNSTWDNRPYGAYSKPPHPLGRWPSNLLLEDDEEIATVIEARLFKRFGP